MPLRRDNSQGDILLSVSSTSCQLEVLPRSNATFVATRFEPGRLPYWDPPRTANPSGLVDHPAIYNPHL